MKLSEESKEKLIAVWREQKGEITLRALAERFNCSHSSARRALVAAGETCSNFCTYCKKNNTLIPSTKTMMIMGKLHKGLLCTVCGEMKWYRRYIDDHKSAV